MYTYKYTKVEGILEQIQHVDENYALGLILN
jgi:hypothetical protein